MIKSNNKGNILVIKKFKKDICEPALFIEHCWYLLEITNAMLNVVVFHFFSNTVNHLVVCMCMEAVLSVIIYPRKVLLENVND